MRQKMTRAYIETLSDAEVHALTIEHPDSPGERAFSLALSDFESREEMAACMAILMIRFARIRQREK